MPDLVSLAAELSTSLGKVAGTLSADYVYDPSDYAKEPHDDYLRKYASGAKRVMLLGMNPGPWGMAQTGVPFGAVSQVRDWLNVGGKINEPEVFHPKRPVLGWDCPREEVSGRRLWDLLGSIYGTAKKMVDELVVVNYCPLLLLEGDEGKCRNLPLDKARGAARLLDVCDAHLAEVLKVVRPEVAIGVGAWAEGRLRLVAGANVNVDRMLHPSPASPMANRCFPQAARQVLARHGVG